MAARLMRVPWFRMPAAAGTNTVAHERLVASLAAFAILMVLHHRAGVLDEVFDAAEYWDMARLEMLTRFPTIRGYLFPLLLIPVRALCEGSVDCVIAYRVAKAAVYAPLLALMLPALFQRAFGGGVTLFRRLVPVLLLAGLFPGVLVYTLSDLPALLLALGGLYLALGAMEATGWRQAGLLAGAGALLGGAYNVRSIYALCGLALLLLLLLGRRVQKGLWRPMSLVPVVVGLLVISLPQLLINQRTRGVSSFAVQAVVGSHNLFASQLVWGLTLQRYETTVAPGAPAPTVFYRDPVGERIYREAVREGDLFSLPHYLRTVARYPLDFIGIYTRHVVNGLDLRDGRVYTQKPSPERSRGAAINFAVLAFACWVLSARVRASRTGGIPAGHLPPSPHWRFALATLLLPVIAIVPGAMETRFFLPLHLLLYCVIAFHFDPATQREWLKAHGPAAVILTAIAAAAFFALSTSTMAQMQYGWPMAYRLGLPV